MTPHDLRHTWGSRHLAAGTPIKWIQERGGWTTAKVLLDVYGHFMPTDVRGFADAIATQMAVRETHQNAPQAHPRLRVAATGKRSAVAKRPNNQQERRSRRPDSNRRPADYESAGVQ